jgi:hypothetical protein
MIRQELADLSPDIICLQASAGVNYAAAPMFMFLFQELPCACCHVS